MIRRKTIEEFVEQSIKIHGYKYNYSKIIYKNNRTKIKILCNICENVFKQIPYSHLNGSGCPKCYFKKLSELYKHTTEEFINNAIKVHGDKYDYSKVNYKNNRIKVKIICPEHGIFKQTPDNHLKCQNCPKCSIKKVSKSQSLGGEIFIKKAKIIHKNIYNYSKVNYNNYKTKINIICEIHGEFLQTPKNHLNGRGCPICKLSKGEIEIKNFFDGLKKKYITQKTFYGCTHKRELKFDFYLPKYSVCIEYDGEQHFNKFSFEKDDKKLNERKLRDKIKNDYCKNNNIPLYRIRYDENIEDKLNLLLEKYLLLI